MTLKLSSSLGERWRRSRINQPNILLGLVGRGALPDRDLKERDILIAGNAPLKGAQRDHDDIVLVRAHGVLPLGVQDADHLTGEFFKTNLCPQGFLPAEQLLAHRLAHDADRRTGAQLAVAELSACPDGSVRHPEILIVASGYRGRPVFIAEYGLDALGRDRGHGSNRADVPGNGLPIAHLEQNGVWKTDPGQVFSRE